MPLKTSPLSLRLFHPAIPEACPGAATRRKPTRSVILVIVSERLWGYRVPESSFLNVGSARGGEGAQP
jgi:hypothetical protein